jgi:hypothetical protein
MIGEPAVRALVAAFGDHVRDHYRDAAASTPHRDRVLEVLNGLAITTATVLAGTGGDDAALAFFQDALERQLAGLLAALGSGEIESEAGKHGRPTGGYRRDNQA